MVGKSAYLGPVEGKKFLLEQEPMLDRGGRCGQGHDQRGNA